MIHGRPRVAHLLASLEVGGKERLVTALQAGRGGDDIIITFEPATEREQFAPTGILIPLDRTQGCFPDDLAAAVARHGVDIVHAHGHVATIYAAAAAKRAGCRTVATLHSALGADWQWLLPVRRSLRAMDQCTAVSRELAVSFRTLSGRAVACVPPGIAPVSAKQSPALRAGQHSYRIGMVSRLHPVKRHSDAFAAIAMLREDGLTVSLHVAGSGPSSARLHALAGDGVHFRGYVREISDFLADIDIFLICSAHEGTPLALLEAMASAVPAIATRVGGIPDMVGAGTDAPCALLIPPRRPRAIADAIRTLIDSPALRETLAARGQGRARSYDLPGMIARYEEIYSEVSAARFR